MKIERNRTTLWLALAALIVLLQGATVLMAQDALLAGTDEFAKGATETSEVNLDKNMLGLAATQAGKGKGMADLMEKMDFVYVRSYTYAKPGEYKMADVEKITKRLSGGAWSHLVKERSATESTDVCVRTDEEGQLSELVVISAEPTELSFVHLKGHVSLGDLRKLGQFDQWDNAGAASGPPALKTRPQ